MRLRTFEEVFKNNKTIDDSVDFDQNVQIHNCPVKLSTEEWQQFFSACGVIKEVIENKTNEPHVTSSAVIKFEQRKGAKKACELNLTYFLDKILFIKSLSKIFNQSGMFNFVLSKNVSVENLYKFITKLIPYKH